MKSPGYEDSLISPNDLIIEKVFRQELEANIKIKIINCVLPKSRICNN